MITNRDYIFISHALNEALKSSMKYKHGSVIRKGKKIIAKGYNKPFIVSIGCKPNTCSLHAEVASLKDLIHRNIKNRNLILYVVRISNNEIMNSKPCLNCRNTLIDHGITKIVYSINNIEFIKENINETETKEIMHHSML